MTGVELSGHYASWEAAVRSREGYRLRRFLLKFLSFFYSAGVFFRNRAYDRGIFSIRKAAVPVLSVGNLSVGGTGKTSVVLWCAERLLKKGIRPAIVSRGYRRKTGAEKVLIVSNGKEVLGSPEDCGDEPVMMARRLKEVPVIVGAGRFEAAEEAVKRFKPDCILLDDGFQHRNLARDWDLVLLDEKTFDIPFMFPRGVLREGFGSLKRAHFAAAKVSGGDPGPMRERLLKAAGTMPSALFEYEAEKAEQFRGKKVMAVSGIANPAGFEGLLKRSGAEVVKAVRFDDHHAYQPDELERLAREAEAAGLMLVTTEKDAVKFGKEFPAQVCRVSVRWVFGEDNLEQSLLEHVK